MPRVSIENTRDIDPISTYKLSDMDTEEGNQYFGYMDSEGAWYIMNLTTTTARYKKGKDNYLDAWDHRGDQGYDYFNNVF